MKYQLDINRCAPYITESLSDGLEMSRLLLDRIGKGGAASVSAYLPEGLSDEAIYDFRSGGLRLKVAPTDTTSRQRPYAVDEAAMDGGEDGLAVRVLRHLSVSPESCCVLEECNRTASDDLQHYWDKYTRAPLLAHHNGLYHYLHHGIDDADLIRRTVSQADATWHFVGILSAAPPQLKISPCLTTITEEILKYLCDHTFTIIIGAYDGESWLECELPTRQRG